MYGLWLYKELKTEYGFAKVEVFRKGYTASAIEIGAFQWRKHVLHQTEKSYSKIP